MQKNIEDYLFLKENFLSDDFCDHTTDILSKAPFKKHDFDKYEEEQYALNAEELSEESETLDINSLSNLNNMFLGREIEKIDTHIMGNIGGVLKEYLTSFEYSWIRGWGGYSPVKHIRYTPGQEMRAHWDNVNSIFPGEPKGIPMISIIGFMNDDYEGGNMFLSEDKKIDVKKGSLLVFPSSFMYPHQITPITKGVRHSYVSWVW